MAKRLSEEELLKKYENVGSVQSSGGGPGGPGPGGPGGGPGRGPKGEDDMKKPSQTGDTIKRLAHYIAGNKKWLALVAVCLLGYSGATLAASYLLRPILNTLVDSSMTMWSRLTYLGEMIGVMAAVYAVAVVCNYLQSRIMLSISQSALQKLRNDLFEKLEHLPVRYYDQNSNGDLMSRFTNDVDTIGELLNSTLVQLVSGVISIVGTLCIMLYTNWILTIITIISIPIIAKLGGTIASRSRKYYTQQQAALGAVNGYVEEMVTGQKVVKVFGHEETAKDEFGTLSDALQKRQMSAQFLSACMGPVMGNFSQLTYAITATVGAVLCITSGFDIGGLTIFVNYSRQFSRPINELSQQMNTIFSALAGAERVFTVLDEEPEQLKPMDVNADGTPIQPLPGEIPPEDAPKPYTGEPMQGYVRLTNVTFGYKPEKTILKEINCYAKPGQKIAFVGSTGAGKTTITNLINRFYEVNQGCITIDGIDVRNYPLDVLRKNIAMVLQDTHLFTGTVMENIRYGRPDATDEEVIEAAKLASADSFIQRLSDGYDTMLEGDGANLSQGQRQLLNIARAAVTTAPILILDEATSSVDTRTERHIEIGLDNLMANRTTFVIAHRLSTVRNSHAIMVLEHGEIIERGTHDELLAMGGRYYNLYTGKAELS
ncbi:MAG: ABC transporter ATP-binding protein/permease [Lachnospiraceae bacterium]|nr:ABC transporter ATP-binding protein/permease [Lachnospiraceae bacterium]